MSDFSPAGKTLSLRRAVLQPLPVTGRRIPLSPHDKAHPGRGFRGHCLLYCWHRVKWPHAGEMPSPLKLTDTGTTDTFGGFPHVRYQPARVTLEVKCMESLPGLRLRCFPSFATSGTNPFLLAFGSRPITHQIVVSGYVRGTLNLPTQFSPIFGQLTVGICQLSIGRRFESP